MTLVEVIDALNYISLQQPAVNQYIKSGNIYDLNEDRNARFGVFCCTQQTHSYDYNTGLNTFQFVLYYVDRQKSNADNAIQIQSTGIEVLKNVLRTFSKTYDVDLDTSDFVVFTESFAELCSGAFTTVNIQTYDDNCVVDY